MHDVGAVLQVVQGVGGALGHEPLANRGRVPDRQRDEGEEQEGERSGEESEESGKPPPPPDSLAKPAPAKAKAAKAKVVKSAKKAAPVLAISA